MKRLISVVTAVLALAGFACAQSDYYTNSDYGVTKGYQSESVLLGTQVGYSIATYDFDRHGGAVGTIDLSFKGRDQVPDNAIIIGGWVDVTSAVLPAGSTNALHVQSAGDLLVAGTTLNATGIDELVPKVEDSATFIKMTDDRDVTLTISNTAITSGVFKVIIPWIMSH